MALTKQEKIRGPLVQMARGEWRRRLSGAQLSRTNLGADWLEGLRTGPRRAGLEKEKRAHLRLGNDEDAPAGRLGGRNACLARPMGEKGEAGGSPA